MSHVTLRLQCGPQTKKVLTATATPVILRVDKAYGVHAVSYQTNRFRNPKRRAAIFNQDGNRCAYCLVDLTTLAQKYWTVDHINPRSNGGDNSEVNLITACHMCNSRRGDTPIHQFVGQETLVRLIRDYPRVARTIVECISK